MAAVAFGDDRVRFISDASGTPNQELCDAIKQNWDANSYAAAVEAITAKAKEMSFD